MLVGADHFTVAAVEAPVTEVILGAPGFVSAVVAFAEGLHGPWPTVFAAVAGDVYCAFDYRTLAARAAQMAALDAPAMHLVMVPNPPFHPAGDFVLRDDGRLSLAGTPRVTFGSIGVYDTRMFRDIVPGTHRALSPYFKATIEAGRATGELYEGIWENVGTPAQLGELDARLRAAAG